MAGGPHQTGAPPIRFARGPWPRTSYCDVIGVEPDPSDGTKSRVYVSPHLRRVSAPFGPLWVGVLRPEWLKGMTRVNP
ncbi:hypothetical protein BH11ARM2_BH11ARM2_35030 [soil metagenome]